MKTFEELQQEEYGVEPPMPTEKDISTSSKKEKPHYIADFPELCEIVEVDNHGAFLTFHGELVNEVEIRATTYLCPNIDKLAFDIPSYAQIRKYLTDVTDVSHKTPEKHLEAKSGITDVTDVWGERVAVGRTLFKDLQTFHEESAELPDKRLYMLIAAWDIHTHLLNKFEYSPIIFFSGLPEKGKSRMAKSMIAVARRGIIKASVTDAQIIREASDQGATIFFDMTDFWQSISESGSKDVVLSRFERGLKVARVLNPEKGAFEDMTYFKVFGPTIIASNETIEQVLGSRTIPIVMKEAKRSFEEEIDFEKAKELQARIIAFKLQVSELKMPKINKIAAGRFGDIVRPLHQIIRLLNPEAENDFIDFIKDVQRKKLITKSQTMEGDIVRAIIEIGSILQKSIIPVKDITEKLNSERTDREKVTYQKIGRKLDIMGYEKGRTSNGASAILWNETLNETLAAEHGVIFSDVSSQTPETPETSVTSETSVTNNINNIGINNNNIIEETKKIFEVEQKEIPF